MMPKVSPDTLSLSPLCRSPSKILNRLTFWAIMGNTKNGNRCIKWHFHKKKKILLDNTCTKCYLLTAIVE